VEQKWGGAKMNYFDWSYMAKDGVIYEKGVDLGGEQ
jgi:hypothetical protein